MNKIKVKKLPPESFIFTGEHANPTEIKHIQYNKQESIVFDSLKELKEDYVDWIIVEGLKDVDKVKDLCFGYNVDPLIVEDILNVNQRNKIELHKEYVFGVQRYSYFHQDAIMFDYISYLLFDDKLITFSEHNNLFITDILKRLEDKKSILRMQKHNYLFYVLYDMVVDEQLEVYNSIAMKIDVFERNLLSLKRQDEIDLYKLRKEMIFVRSTCSQILDNLFRNSSIVSKVQDTKSKKYYIDLEDHLINLVDKAKYELDVITNIFDIYLNNMSHRMNNIMTTLTIFSAIFIPLSFLAGVFGMNFIEFDILKNENGLLYFIFLCLGVSGIMITYFRLKKWF